MLLCCCLQQREAQEREPETSGGFLNFNRFETMDDPNSDITPLLIAAREKKEAEAKAKAEAEAAATKSRSRKPNPVLLAPSKVEAKRLERTGRMQKRASVAVAAAIGPITPEAEQLAQTEREKYEQLKQELLLWNAGFIALGFTTTYTAYTRDIAFSYLVGAVGGYMYLRLLNKSVDGFGGQGLESAASAAAGQQRLLIPLLLALAYNRWNALFAEQYAIQLELLPMLVGFFTYKLAVVSRQSLELMKELSAKPNSG